MKINDEMAIPVDVPVSVRCEVLRLRPGDMIVLRGPPADCYWTAQELAKTHMGPEINALLGDIPVLMWPAGVTIETIDAATMEHAGFVRKDAP